MSTLPHTDNSVTQHRVDPPAPELAEADLLKGIAAYFDESARMLRATGEQCTRDIAAVAVRMVEVVTAGGKIMFCGNGGSAADAQHWAAELVSGLDKTFQRPGIAAVALTTDTSFLTAYANDYGYAGTFARQVEALGRPGDALVLISTTGGSENLCRAAAEASARGISSIGLLGGDGGRLLPMVNQAIIVPGNNTQRIQECHTAILHVICEFIENHCFRRERLCR